MGTPSGFHVASIGFANRDYVVARLIEYGTDPLRFHEYARSPYSARNSHAHESGHKSLLAIAAKAVEVDDGDPAIFKLQETFLLQPLQALIGVLPGDA